MLSVLSFICCSCTETSGTLHERYTRDHKKDRGPDSGTDFVHGFGPNLSFQAHFHDVMTSFSRLGILGCSHIPPPLGQWKHIIKIKELEEKAHVVQISHHLHIVNKKPWSICFCVGFGWAQAFLNHRLYPQLSKVVWLQSSKCLPLIPGFNPLQSWTNISISSSNPVLMSKSIIKIIWSWWVLVLGKYNLSWNITELLSLHYFFNLTTMKPKREKNPNKWWYVRKYSASPYCFYRI